MLSEGYTNFICHALQYLVGRVTNLRSSSRDPVTRDNKSSRISVTTVWCARAPENSCQCLPKLRESTLEQLPSPTTYSMAIEQTTVLHERPIPIFHQRLTRFLIGFTFTTNVYVFAYPMIVLGYTPLWSSPAVFFTFIHHTIVILSSAEDIKEANASTDSELKWEAGTIIAMTRKWPIIGTWILAGLWLPSFWDNMNSFDSSFALLRGGKLKATEATSTRAYAQVVGVEMCLSMVQLIALVILAIVGMRARRQLPRFRPGIGGVKVLM